MSVNNTRPVIHTDERAETCAYDGTDEKESVCGADGAVFHRDEGHHRRDVYDLDVRAWRYLRYLCDDVVRSGWGRRVR